MISKDTQAICKCLKDISIELFLLRKEMEKHSDKKEKDEKECDGKPPLT